MTRKSIEEAAQEEISYMQKRLRGEIKSVKTPWHKFNKSGIDGVEPGTINLIGAMSGVGKTSFANQWINSVQDINPGLDIVVYFHTMEMAARRQIGRSISHDLKRSVQNLYTTITEEDVAHIQKELIPKYNQRKIYYEETTTTVPRTLKRTKDFIMDFPNQVPLIVYDHSSLVNREPGYSERETLIQLVSGFNNFKKIFPLSIYVILSQLNRDIEADTRIVNKKRHYPQKSDIFGSDAMWQFSDIVLVLHDPYKLGITQYGPLGWPTNGFIFGHFLKIREGKPGIMILKNELEFNNLRELRKKEAEDYGFVTSRTKIAPTR